MRTLVLGADGFIGRHLMPQLGDAIAYQGNICDLASLDEAMRQAEPEIVINLAGLFRGTREEMVGVNATGAINAFKIANAYGARFITAGSAAEYGPVPPEPVREDRVCKPTSDYGQSKLMATEVVLDSACVFRPSNIIGPSMSKELLLGNVVAQLKSGAKKVAVSSLHTIRDYVDVRDVASAIVILMNAPPGVRNVSSGVGTSTKALLSLIPSDFEVHELASLRGKDEVDVFIADSGQLRSLGWEPKFSLAESVHDTWEAS
ncbi:MAG: NAD(P)-dependent oxidoreductase [Fimbriimonadaceae bacterium]|nr:NAD(P)-dependent oxidoreductase [Fimbriimonadaceae bacterium]